MVALSLRWIGGWLCQPETAPAKQIRARLSSSVGRGPRGGVLPFPRAPEARPVLPFLRAPEARQWVDHTRSSAPNGPASRRTRRPERSPTKPSSPELATGETADTAAPPAAGARATSGACREKRTT